MKHLASKKDKKEVVTKYNGILDVGLEDGAHRIEEQELFRSFNKYFTFNIIIWEY
jgi:hypothetical protein